MKKLIFILNTIIIVSTMYAQDPYFTDEDLRESHPSEYYWNLFWQMRPSGNSSEDMSTQTYRSGGIQFTREAGRTSSHSNYYAQQRQRKAQQSANRAAFNARRQEILKQQALIAAEKKRLEDERKFKLYHNDYIAATQAGINKTKSIAADKATIGRQSVYNDVDNFMSQRFVDPVYVPQPPVTPPTFDLIVPLSGVNENNLLSAKYYGVGTSNPKYSMDEAFNESLKALKNFKPEPVKFDRKDEKIWGKMREQLDTMQLKGIYYIMKSMGEKVDVVEKDKNGNEVIKKEIVFPNAIGVNNDGNFIFESENGKRIFSVSPKGVLTYATFEEHTWDDDNIIKKINDGDWSDDVKTSTAGGNLTVKDIDNKKISLSHNLEKDENVLPDMKLKMKMTVFDNSSSIKAEKIYFAPESLGSFVIGIGGELSAGGKADVKLNTGLSIKDSSRYHEFAELKAEITTTKLHGNIMVGKMCKKGLAVGYIDGGVDVKLDLKTILTLNPLRVEKKIEFEYKQIDINNSQLPGLNKKK